MEFGRNDFPTVVASNDGLIPFALAHKKTALP
jgi:hypothetical protein